MTYSRQGVNLFILFEGGIVYYSAILRTSESEMVRVCFNSMFFYNEIAIFRDAENQVDSLERFRDNIDSVSDFLQRYPSSFSMEYCARLAFQEPDPCPEIEVPAKVFIPSP